MIGLIILSMIIANLEFYNKMDDFYTYYLIVTYRELPQNLLEI
jgi:hypothetical protein